MKTNIKYLLSFVLLLAAGLLPVACSEDLETNPTDRVSGSTIFADEIAAQTAIEGCYTLLYQGVYVTGNLNQAEGHQSTIFAQELMGDDIVTTVTTNWYGFDYSLLYTRQIQIDDWSRSHNIWNMYYTLISNVNYIIAEDGNIGSNGNAAKDIVAQAYALRAFAYFELIQAFQKTYLGHENDPGVPVYTEPTRSGDEGKSRGTVEEVYAQINSDIARALELFTETGKTKQTHSSHVDYYVTKGFEARIALVQGRWADAANAAAEARTRPSLRLLAATEITTGMSNYQLPSNLWAMEVLPEQSTIYFYYLDHRGTNGGTQQRKCISKWLYDQLNRYPTDARLAWFKNGNQGYATSGEFVNYGQMKLRIKDIAAAPYAGDHIFMRAEELLLIEAEAKARMPQQAADAKNLLLELAQNRLPVPALTTYTTYLNTLSTAVNTLPALTTTDPATVLEEVLLQRRIELWGEIGRIKDILRLKQGYTRDYPGSNHTDKLLSYNTGAESGAFLCKIPQAEFDGNKNILSSEQNPVN
ncbi:MAG: RagB/SusD family nutrient uptake outer membrane protein [Prevotellaceae bacterium]|jgi:hypothetical protein|nr:RagB/SusD family nutrient uptake outer membrane protein [Prevotellaceae bacterium]